MRAWALLALLLPLRAAAQEIPPPEQCVGLDPVPPSELSFDVGAVEERVEQVFASRGAETPGVAALVLHEGRIVLQRAYGMASLEHGVPFTVNHVARLPYSEGREFLAIAAALLEFDGLIDLDDRVRERFPRLPEWAEAVTLRDLLEHRSGFVDEWSVLLLMHASMANRFDEPQFLRLLYEQPLPEIEPGVGYMYSNSDYGLLRLVLERATPGGLAEYLRRRLFDPLGMTSTHLVGDVAAAVPNLAPFYSPTDGGYRHMDVKTSPGGDYAIATTACDLARWAVAHADSTSDVAAAVRRLAEGAATVPGRDGHHTWGHTRAAFGGEEVGRHEGVLEVNYLTRVPGRGLAVVTFGNGPYEPAENLAIVEALLPEADETTWVEFPVDPVPIENLERFAGRFVSIDVPSWESRSMARELISIEHVDGRLQLDWPLWDRFDLIPLGGARFASARADVGSIRLLLEFTERDGAPADVAIHFSDGYPSETYARLDEWSPAPQQLRRLAGTYYSEHLDYHWTLMVDDTGRLALRAPTLPSLTLEPYSEGEFLLRHERFPGMPYHVWIRFHENADGEVTHLTAWNPRMNHRFERRGPGG